MRYINRFYFCGLIISIFLLQPRLCSGQAEESDSLMNAYLRNDSLALADLESDSLSILDFIDSLLNTDYSMSALSVRAGYISNITNAGRDMGIEQFGFSGGISYYHKSGFFGDISGFWNSDLVPAFNPLVTTAGYMLSSIPKFSLTASYDHYFYFSGSDSLGYYFPFTNSLNISPYLDLKFLSVGVNYSFLFGDQTAHRIRPDIYGIISINHVGFIDKIQFLPGVSMYWGNQDVITQNTQYLNLKDFIRKVGFNRFRILYSQYGDTLLQYIYQEEVNNVFGLLNYNFSLPVNFYIGNFTLSCSYFYNIPVALPGEQIDLSPNSYFSTSIIYSIPFIKAKSRKF